MSLHECLGSRAALRGRLPGATPAGIECNVPTGGEVITSFGPAFVIEQPDLPAMGMPQPGPSRHLLQNLQLIYGVGPVTENRLRAEGYTDLVSLLSHPRWGCEARRMVEAIEEGDLTKLRLAGARESELLTFFGPDEIAVVDIETAGLARALPVFLIGVAWQDGESWRRRQFLARDFDEERGVLSLASDFFAGRPGLISYNGRAFDVPFLQARLAFHGMNRISFLLHLDIYQETRRMEGVFSDRKLHTVIHHMFGLHRGDDIPGYLVPELYFRYLQESRPELLQPILEHNARDLEDVCRLVELCFLFPGDRMWLQKAAGVEQRSYAEGL